MLIQIVCDIFVLYDSPMRCFRTSGINQISKSCQAFYVLNFSSDFLPGSMGSLSFLLLLGDPSEDVLMTHGKPQLSSFVLFRGIFTSL